MTGKTELTEAAQPAPPGIVRSSDGLGPLPPHRKVTAFGRVWIEEDMLAYGRQERAAERALWQEMAATHVTRQYAISTALRENTDSARPQQNDN